MTAASATAPIAFDQDLNNIDRFLADPRAIPGPLYSRLQRTAGQPRSAQNTWPLRGADTLAVTRHSCLCWFGISLSHSGIARWKPRPLRERCALPATTPT